MTLGASRVSSSGDHLFRLVCLRYGPQRAQPLDHSRYGERLDHLRETRVRDVLYPRLFGVVWSEIDAALQRMHCNGEPVHAAGVFRISHGTSLGAKLLLLFLRLPPPNAAAQVELIVRPVGESETWLRLFDGKPVITVQRESVSGLLAERFGPIELRFRLSFADHTIHYRQVGVILRLALPFFPEIPLPRWASPHVSAWETAGASESETRVQVEVSAPFAGLLFSYEGKLRREKV
jgi:uncharacterized protein DUF4166